MLNNQQMKPLQHKSQKVIIGRLGRPVGIHGQIKLYPYSREPSNLLDYNPWFIEDENDWQVIEFSKVIEKDKFLLVTFNSVKNREQAQKLTNKSLAVNRESLAQLGADEYYWSDLIGLSVTNTNGTSLGVVTEIMETGANDVLIVCNEDKQYLVPFLLNEFILQVSLETNSMTVDWDENF